MSGHSLKSTTLDWCGKYGMSDKDQTLLGHHALRGESMYSYMRDKLAAPLRAYEQMLLSVRHALFLPDSTRSGMFKARASESAEVLGHASSEDPRRVIPEEQQVCPSNRPISEALSDAPGGRTDSEHDYYTHP